MRNESSLILFILLRSLSAFSAYSSRPSSGPALPPLINRHFPKTHQRHAFGPFGQQARTFTYRASSKVGELWTFKSISRRASYLILVFHCWFGTRMRWSLCAGTLPGFFKGVGPHLFKLRLLTRLSGGPPRRVLVNVTFFGRAVKQNKCQKSGLFNNGLCSRPRYRHGVFATWIL